MIIGAACVWFLYEGWSVKYNKLFLSSLAVISIAFPFVVNEVDYSYTSNNLNEKINYPLPLELLYNPSDPDKVEIPSVDMRAGKHVVAFLSLSCPHCRIAAKKFRLIKKNNPSLPIYFILNGDKAKYSDFMKETRADNIPSSFCLGRSFVQLSSAHLPRIYYLDNGVVKKKVDYFELSQYDIEKWLTTGKTD